MSRRRALAARVSGAAGYIVAPAVRPDPGCRSVRPLDVVSQRGDFVRGGLPRFAGERTFVESSACSHDWHRGTMADEPQRARWLEPFCAVRFRPMSSAGIQARTSGGHFGQAIQAGISGRHFRRAIQAGKYRRAIQDCLFSPDFVHSNPYTPPLLAERPRIPSYRDGAAHGGPPDDCHRLRRGGPSRASLRARTLRSRPSFPRVPADLALRPLNLHRSSGHPRVSSEGNRNVIRTSDWPEPSRLVFVLRIAVAGSRRTDRRWRARGPSSGLSRRTRS